MPVLSFGSLNIDHVYQLPHIVRPGETVAADSYTIHPGGKGLNQCLAMARAGLQVCHAGRVGKGGLWLCELLQEAGVDCRFIEYCEQQYTGQAIVQVCPEGQNSIVIYGGANQSWTVAAVQQLFSDSSANNWQAVVCQNEMNGLPALLDNAYGRNIPVIFNAAPYGPALQGLDLSPLHTLLVNETEAMELAGAYSIEAAFSQLKKRYPTVRLIMTLGADGLWASYQQQDYSLPAFPAELVDSTAAGDTFAGYYAASILNYRDFEAALVLGSRAAALAVNRAGAAPSIPYLADLGYT